ncbi:hypothetical protein ANCCAN_08033 [Ancylostoma caninum]|uniref:Uncharacterized protein n=1 Tax=Ancylostoma caninum TaxID=29170 RepID=A0A368GSN5_ANCCA|nr:hypothetical protein ANCCAN_08033 [Ancylostoma caninum]
MNLFLYSDRKKKRIQFSDMSLCLVKLWQSRSKNLLLFLQLFQKRRNPRPRQRRYLKQELPSQQSREQSHGRCHPLLSLSTECTQGLMLPFL